MIGLCTCGTPINAEPVRGHNLATHKKSVWHRIAPQVRKYREQGLSYSEIAWRLPVQITSQGLQYHMKKEAKYRLTSSNEKRTKVKS